MKHNLAKVSLGLGLLLLGRDLPAQVLNHTIGIDVTCRYGLSE